MMEALLNDYGRLVGEIGLAGFAILAVVRLWNRLIEQADKHREDWASRDKAHRDEMKEIEAQHRAETAAMVREHREDVKEIVSRNMGIHEERTRIQTKMGMQMAEAFAANGLEVPDPYPDIDESGRMDPRKKR